MVRGNAESIIDFPRYVYCDNGELILTENATRAMLERNVSLFDNLVARADLLSVLSTFSDRLRGNTTLREVLPPGIDIVTPYPRVPAPA